jgi:XTP/dITP diphosphohydrolase
MQTPQEIAFTRLLKIMDELREQCPWDKKQTIESLRHLTIEETYELSDAIMENNMPDLKKELGDILLHIVFYAKIADEKKEFNITDVINSLCDKMITRHPHIYGDVKVENAEQVKQNWEKIKLSKEGNKTVLGGVPKGLPAMIKAERIQEKVRGVGFEWDNPEQVWQKVEEEINELKAEIVSKKSAKKTEEEFGDVLFTLINYARFLNISPETALEKANKKFIRRFEFIEQKINEQGKSITDSNLTEMDVFWNEAKKQGL